MRHGTDGFTSPPKEGMLWNFSPEKCDGFGQVRTCDFGYQRPAPLTLIRIVKVTANENRRSGKSCLIQNSAPREKNVNRYFAV
jgi:hypothetical protein